MMRIRNRVIEKYRSRVRKLEQDQMKERKKE